MASMIDQQVVSAAEYLNLVASAPDYVTTELIRGQVRQRERVIPPRFSVAVARIGHHLANWLDESNHEGCIAGGGGLCRLSKSPDTIVGIDVAYYADGQASDCDEFFDETPIVAVEILAPTDNHGGDKGRIRNFLSAGVKQVWVADPDFRSVTVHRPGVEQRLFTRSQELDGEPELPGFQRVVESLFVGRYGVPST